jgi:hypothetical protein
MEGAAEYLYVEVDRVAALIPFRPAPIAFLYDETGEVGHPTVAASGLDEEVSTFFQQRDQIAFAGDANFPASTSNTPQVRSAAVCPLLPVIIQDSGECRFRSRSSSHGP